MRMLHVTIQTAHFADELAFYENYVGLSIQRDMRPMGTNMVFLANAAGETCVEIIEKADALDAGNANLSVGFAAEDLDAKRAELLAAGFEVTPFITPNPHVRFFFAKDPAGVSVQFM